MDYTDLKLQYAELHDSVDARIRAVLDHGQYILGPEVAELESRLAHYTGAAHCITAASGTESLLMALMAIGIAPGDEVITTPFSFIATAEVIVLLRAVPVFVDVLPDSGLIDAARIEERITDRTRAIIPVSLYGQPADMDEINAIARRHGLRVIEDGAQSFGASYRDKKSGNLSDIGCTSFFPSKPLGCYGDGGAIFTSDDSLAQALREIRVHGQSRRYVHTRIGVGGRMDTLQCAVVLAKLDRFDWEVRQRRRLGGVYAECFGDRVERMGLRADRTTVHAQYTICVDQRDAVQRWLHERGIPTAVHYPVPIPDQPAYAAYATYAGATPCPVASHLARRVLSLPFGPYMAPAQLARVAEAVLAAQDQTLPS